jgi:polyphosphate kinase 2
MSKQHADEARPKMKRKEYEEELVKLQTEVCRLQDWIVHKGLRVVIVFKGRDAAGKGGMIQAITERTSPRVFRLVALSAPSDRERTQNYVQRYLQHFPTSCEVVIFDRNQYNRADVEYVMGFCAEDQYKTFLKNCPRGESFFRENGIILVKYWLEVGQKEQERRFEARIEDPMRQWKLSPMDLESYARWYSSLKARDLMLEATDNKDAPCYIVLSDDKRRARLNCVSHLLSLIDYNDAPRQKVKLPKRSHEGECDDQATFEGRTFIEDKY